jgi:hypothetical protein
MHAPGSGFLSGETDPSEFDKAGGRIKLPTYPTQARVTPASGWRRVGGPPMPSSVLLGKVVDQSCPLDPPMWGPVEKE